MNISDILRNAPEGIELYSPAFGVVKFKAVEEGDMILTYVHNTPGNDIPVRFYSDGRYLDLDTAACVLFPSKDSDDWDFFKEQLKRNVTLTTDKQKSVKEVLDMIYKWLIVNGNDYVYLDEINNDKTYTVSLDVNGLFEAIEELIGE